MKTTLKIDVEELKKSMLQRRPMKARFRIPMSEDKAYAYLLAAIMLRWNIDTVSSVLTKIWRSNFRRWLIGLPHHHPISASCCAVDVEMARVQCLKHSNNC